MKTAERNEDATGHVACSEFAMSLHTETSTFSREAETGKAPIDCGATRSMGSCGSTRMSEQLYGSPRFSLEPTRKTSQVNVGRVGDCKIACLNATGVPILLSVQSRSRMGAFIDFSTGAAFFRNLTDPVFVQLDGERTMGIICEGDQCLGFRATATPFTLVDGETSEVEKEVSMDRNVCLATTLHSSRTSHTCSQQTPQATSHHLQTGTTSSTTDTRQPLDSMPSSLTDFVPLPVRIDEQRFPCLDRNSTVSGRTNAFN